MTNLFARSKVKTKPFDTNTTDFLGSNLLYHKSNLCNNTSRLKPSLAKPCFLFCNFYLTGFPYWVEFANEIN